MRCPPSKPCSRRVPSLAQALDRPSATTRLRACSNRTGSRCGWRPAGGKSATPPPLPQRPRPRPRPPHPLPLPNQPPDQGQGRRRTQRPGQQPGLAGRPKTPLQPQLPAATMFRQTLPRMPAWPLAAPVCAATWAWIRGQPRTVSPHAMPDSPWQKRAASNGAWVTRRAKTPRARLARLLAAVWQLTSMAKGRTRSTGVSRCKGATRFERADSLPMLLSAQQGSQTRASCSCRPRGPPPYGSRPCRPACKPLWATQRPVAVRLPTQRSSCWPTWQPRLSVRPVLRQPASAGRCRPALASLATSVATSVATSKLPSAPRTVTRSVARSVAGTIAGTVARTVAQALTHTVAQTGAQTRPTSAAQRPPQPRPCCKPRPAATVSGCNWARK